MSKVLLKIGSCFDDDGGYDEITYPVDRLVPNTHQYLLDFVGADLSVLEAAAADCLAMMNFVRPSQSSLIEKTILGHVSDCLIGLHPIYRFANSTALVAINRAFARQIAYRLSRECKEPMDKERYFSFVKTVCDDRYIGEEWLEQYLEYALQDRMATDAQMSAPIFDELDEIQRIMKLLVYLVFDCTNQQFASVPAEKRAAVYCALFHGEYDPFLSINSEMNISSPSDIRHTIARIEFSDSEDFGIRLFDLANQNDALPPDELVEMMNAAKENNEDLVVETYDTTDLQKLFSYETMMMIKEQVRVKRCKNCHGYFIIDNPKVEYCNRIVAGETKPCSEIGKTRVYQRKIEGDEPTLCYRKAYKTRYARIKSGRMTKGEFSTWAAEAYAKLAHVKNGQLPLDDFKTWLRQAK